MFEAWKVPKRPVEVSCDVTQHLVAYQTAVETRTKFNSSGMRTHTRQHSRLPCMHTLIFARVVVRIETDDVTPNLRCTKATLQHLLEEFSFPNLPKIVSTKFSISTSIPGRLISESKIWWQFPFKARTGPQGNRLTEQTSLPKIYNKLNMKNRVECGNNQVGGELVFLPDFQKYWQNRNFEEVFENSKTNNPMLTWFCLLVSQYKQIKHR